MAASGTFKRNARQARNVTVEDSFSNGVYVSDTPIATGYSRTLVNYRIDNNTKRLVNRPGLEKVYKEPYTFYLDSVNENCFITDNHLLSIDNTDNLQYVTGFVNIDTNNYFIEPSYLGYNSKITYANLKEDISFLIEDVNNKTINLTKTDTTDKHFIKREYKTKILLGPEQGIYVHSCFSKPFSPLPKAIEAVVQNKYVSIAQYKSNADVEYIVKDNKELAKLNYYDVTPTESKLNSFKKGELLYTENIAMTEESGYSTYWYLCLEDINDAVCYTLNNILTVASTQDSDIKILCLKEHEEPIESFIEIYRGLSGWSVELGNKIIDGTNKLWLDTTFIDMYYRPFLQSFYCVDLGSTYVLAVVMIYPSTYEYDPFHNSYFDAKIQLQMGSLNTVSDYVSFTNADVKDWKSIKCANDSLTMSVAIFNNKRLKDQNGNLKSSYMSDWLKMVQEYGDDSTKTKYMPIIAYSQVTDVLNNIANNINKAVTTHTLPTIKDSLNNVPITFSKATRYGYYKGSNQQHNNLIALSNIDLTDNWAYNVFANCNNIGYKATLNSTTIKKDTLSTISESIVAVIENNTNSTICCVSDTEADCKLIGYLDGEKDNNLELITNTLLINNKNYFYSYLLPKQKESSYNASDLFTDGILNFAAEHYEEAITNFINRFNASGESLSSCIYRIEYNNPNNTFDIKLYTPYTPTPTIAVNTGYNMLLNNPYTFTNEEASVFTINGCTFYSNDVIKIQLTPGEEVLGRIYYTTPTGREYSVKVQYRTKEKDIYIPITTINKTIETDLPDLTFKLVVPNEDFYIFIEVTEIYEDDTSKVIYEVELPYSVKTSNITYLDSPPNYDLGTAQGVVTWKSRLYLWGVNNAPNIIFASDVLYPVEYFPYPNNIIEYAEPVLHVIEFLDSLLVFTERHIYQTKLDSDGITWTTNTVAGNIYFTPSDIYSIVPIKNMLFYKSGDYYYMLVPSTSYVTLGELKVARISEPINNFLNDFYNKMKEIIAIMYPNLKDAEYIPTSYSVFVDGDVIKINYGFKTINSINFIFVLNYDTLNRLWYFDIINMPYYGTLRQYRQSILGESYYSYIAPNINRIPDKEDNYFKLYLLKYINNANDFYNPVTNVLPVRQFYDSGYKDINPEWKKRFREVQFKVSQPDSKRLYFKPNFILDEENRLQNNNYVLQLIEGGDYIYAPSEEYIAYGKATLEPSDEEYFLELGGENFDSHKFNLLRCKVSGKGYYPRFQIVGDNQIPYEIHNINWVFRNMNLR